MKILFFVFLEFHLKFTLKVRTVLPGVLPHLARWRANLRYNEIQHETPDTI